MALKGKVEEEVEKEFQCLAGKWLALKGFVKPQFIIVFWWECSISIVIKSACCNQSINQRIAVKWALSGALCTSTWAQLCTPLITIYCGTFIRPKFMHNISRSRIVRQLDSGGSLGGSSMLRIDNTPAQQCSTRKMLNLVNTWAFQCLSSVMLTLFNALGSFNAFCLASNNIVVSITQEKFTKLHTFRMKPTVMHQKN